MSMLKAKNMATYGIQAKFTRTECPRSDVSDKNITRAFSSSEVWYCWHWVYGLSSVCAIMDRTKRDTAPF